MIISLIVCLVLVGLFVWAGTSIVAALPIAEPFKRIAIVLIVVLGVLVVVQQVFGVNVLGGRLWR